MCAAVSACTPWAHLCAALWSDAQADQDTLDANCRVPLHQTARSRTQFVTAFQPQTPKTVQVNAGQSIPAITCPPGYQSKPTWGTIDQGDTMVGGFVPCF